MSKESKGYKNMPKKIYIRTFGCQMNDRDSEALLGLFLEKGYQQAQSEKEAEVILINTCSVREHAEDRAISYAGTFKKTGHGARVKGKGKSKESSSPSPQPPHPIPQH